MATLIQISSGSSDQDRKGRAFEDGRTADPDLEDLIYAWRRLGDPVRRRLAVRLVRALDEHPMDSALENAV